MFNPDDPGFRERLVQSNKLMNNWTVIGGTGKWLEAHLLARASYAGGLPQLAGCGVTEAEVIDLVESIDGKILVMLSESIAPDHGVALINKLVENPEPPDILLMVTDGRWLGSNPLSVCNAGAIIDVHSFGTGTANQALQALAAGKRYVDQRLIRSNSNAMKLSPREQEALILLAQGSTNSEIAKTMGISANTVRDYLSQVYGKLGVRNRSGAAVKAIEIGFVYNQA